MSVMRLPVESCLPTVARVIKRTVCMQVWTSSVQHVLYVVYTYSLIYKVICTCSHQLKLQPWSSDISELKKCLFKMDCIQGETRTYGLVSNCLTCDKMKNLFYYYYLAHTDEH